MAEAVVLDVATNILSTIASSAFQIAYEKACSIKDAREELGELGVTLETIRAVLADAEKKEHDSDAIRKWIKRLKGVLYDAEDLFDEVATDDDLRKQQRKNLPCIDQVWAFFSNCISRNSIAEQVKAIKKSLHGLSTDMVKFGFMTGGQNERPMRRVRDSGWVIDAKSVIGRDEDKKIILKMLSDESDHPLVVITVVGIGGMGKTAMAKLVYDDQEITEKFQKRWFSCISDTSDEREVLEKIFRSIFEESCNPDLNVGQLLTKIRENIEGRKYLLVLDDVWEDQRSRWIDRMSLLSCGAKGSRIIVTTRLPSVNKAMGAVGTHTLEGLSEDDSWNLFKRLAFGAEGEVDPRKERLGREILKKCFGVPLAIQSIGNLLFQEDSLNKWEAIEREGLPKMGGAYGEIMSVLKLSYDHLPSNLKHCFAYCSLFPKDDKLLKNNLINHWTAQGYVEPDDAESAFMYLLRMGFFQDTEKDDCGEISSCKMHDIMHDLALYVAGEESVMLSSISPNNLSKCARHVVSVVNSFEHLTSMPNAKSLRTLMLSGRVELSDVFARFKYLRTLSLACVNIFKIPDSVGELKFMRYLDLKRTCMRKLPNTITNLVNLLSLDLGSCLDFGVFPLDFHKLVNLRYLNVVGCNSLMSMPVGIGGMSNLQHLSDFRTWDELNASDGLPPQLRGKLSIRVGPESGVNIQSWQLPVSLQHLELVYKGAECEITKWLTNGIGSTNNLARLELNWSENVKYLSYLRFLPKLRWLQLHNLSGLEFVEEEEGNDTAHNNSTATSAFFPCLEELRLDKLPKLKGWWRKAAEVTSSSSPGLLEFPLLSKLTIEECPQLDLKSLPPCPGVRLLKVEDYYVEMATGRAATSSNPLSLGGLPKGKNQITDLYMRSEITCSVKSCISDILPLLPILRSFDEYTSIKLVFPHRLYFPGITECKRQRIDVVEEAQMMPTSSLTVLIFKDNCKDNCRYKRSVSSTTHYTKCDHICSITVRPIPGQLSSRWEEFLQRVRSNMQELQMVSGLEFTDDSRTLRRTDFELFSQVYKHTLTISNFIMKPTRVSPRKTASKRKKIGKDSTASPNGEDIHTESTNIEELAVDQAIQHHLPLETIEGGNHGSVDGDVSDNETLNQRKKRLFEADKQMAQSNVAAAKKKPVPGKDKGKGILFTRGDFHLDEERANARRKNATPQFPSINFRGALGVFTMACSKMNAAQRMAVENIGFGSMLKLQDISIPKLLCQWLMEKYNPRKGKIIFPDGQEMDVLEKDVEICLGVPRGRIEIVKLPSLTKTEVLEEWMNHIGKTEHLIRHVDVATAMLNDSSGGESFIRDFLVLFHGCLIEPPQSGAANQSLVRNLECVDQVSSWNWCAFVISCLIEAKKKWDRLRTANFTGPLIFITILYLDRLVIYNKRAVPRSFPSFLGWTIELVTQREHEEVEHGVIGDGNVVSRQSITKASAHKEQKDYPNDSLSDHLLKMAQSIRLFSEHVQKLGEETLEDEITKAVLHTGRSLLGYASDNITPEEGEVYMSQVGRLQNQSQDPFWNNPDVLKMIEAVEQAFYARQKLNKDEEQNYHPHGFGGTESVTDFGVNADIAAATTKVTNQADKHLSLPPLSMQLDQFNPGASTSTTITRQPPSSTNKEHED